MTFCYNKLYDEDDKFMSVLQGEGGGGGGEMTMVSVDRENGWFEKNHKAFRMMTMIWAQTRPNRWREKVSGKRVAPCFRLEPVFLSKLIKTCQKMR